MVRFIFLKTLSFSRTSLHFLYAVDSSSSVTLECHTWLLNDTVILRSVEPTSIYRSSSHRIRQFSQELKAEAVAKAKQLTQDFKQELKRFSWSGRGGGASSSSATAAIESALAARALRKQRAQLDRNKSGAHKAIRGLRFISGAKSNGVDAWKIIEANFEKLAEDGFVSRADFAQCIGMKDSKEFALELFDALSRRRRLNTEKISKEELCEFWSQISDQSFDSRLQIFFDMVDKNEDGRITEAEVKEIIMLSASANKLSRLKEQAVEYAALIMEDLDPERLGYIETRIKKIIKRKVAVRIFECLNVYLIGSLSPDFVRASLKSIFRSRRPDFCTDSKGSVELNSTCSRIFSSPTESFLHQVSMQKNVPKQTARPFLHRVGNKTSGRRLHLCYQEEQITRSRTIGTRGLREESDCMRKLNQLDRWISRIQSSSLSIYKDIHSNHYLFLLLNM